MNVLPRFEGMSFVALAVVAEAFGQLAFKRAADRANDAPAEQHGAIRLVRQRGWLAAGIACFVVEGLLWTCALKFLPVSVAQPAGSLEFVIVAGLARLFLHEKIPASRWVGVMMILCGVLLVGAY